MGWAEMEEVIYIGDNHAVVHATAPPPPIVGGFKERLGAAALASPKADIITKTFFIKAINGRAKHMCKDSHDPGVQAIGTTDAEGEEWADHAQPSDARAMPAHVRQQEGTVYARRTAQNLLATNAAQIASIAGKAHAMKRDRLFSPLATGKAHKAGYGATKK